MNLIGYLERSVDLRRGTDPLHHKLAGRFLREHSSANYGNEALGMLRQDTSIKRWGLLQGLESGTCDPDTKLEGLR